MELLYTQDFQLFLFWKVTKYLSEVFGDLDAKDLKKLTNVLAN